MVLQLLFIGNSLTAANDLPAMVTAMARTAGIEIRCSTIAKPNFSLEDHWNDGEARRAIARGGWTFVVLQQGPSALPESRVLLEEYGQKLDAEGHRVKARPAIFMVWPSSARFGDFDGVSRSYAAAARLVNGVLLPAGDAWRAAWRTDPALPLYGPDGFHPSRLGSLLAALTIVHGLAGVLPRTIAGVAPRDLEIMRSAVIDAASRVDRDRGTSAVTMHRRELIAAGVFRRGESLDDPTEHPGPSRALSAGRSAVAAGDAGRRDRAPAGERRRRRRQDSGRGDRA